MQICQFKLYQAIYAMIPALCLIYSVTNSFWSDIYTSVVDCKIDFFLPLLQKISALKIESDRYW